MCEENSSVTTESNKKTCAKPLSNQALNIIIAITPTLSNYNQTALNSKRYATIRSNET